MTGFGADIDSNKSQTVYDNGDIEYRYTNGDIEYRYNNGVIEYLDNKGMLTLIYPDGTSFSRPLDPTLDYNFTFVQYHEHPIFDERLRENNKITWKKGDEIVFEIDDCTVKNTAYGPDKSKITLLPDGSSRVKCADGRIIIDDPVYKLEKLGKLENPPTLPEFSRVELYDGGKSWIDGSGNKFVKKSNGHLFQVGKNREGKNLRHRLVTPKDYKKICKENGIPASLPSKGKVKLIKNEFYDVVDKYPKEPPIWLPAQKELGLLAACAAFMTLMTYLNGGFSDFAKPENAEGLAGVGADWDEVVRALDTTVTDSVSWSGSAADAFAAQVRVLRDQVVTMRDLDTQDFRPAVAEHAKCLRCFHCVMVPLTAFLDLMALWLTKRVLSGKISEVATLPWQIGLVTAALLIWAGVQIPVWVSLDDKPNKGRQATRNYKLVAGRAIFSGSDQAVANVDQNPTAHQIGMFGLSNTMTSLLMSERPHRSTLTPGTTRGIRGGTNTGDTDKSGAPVAPLHQGSGAGMAGRGDHSSKLTTPSGPVVPRNHTPGPVPVTPTPSPPAAGALGSQHHPLGQSNPTGAHPQQNTPLPPRLPHMPATKAGAHPNNVSQRAPLSPQPSHPNIDLSCDQNAEYDSGYDPTTGLLTE